MSMKEEEAVIGSSKLKMKIKFSHSSYSPPPIPIPIPIPSDTQFPNNYTEQNSSDPIIPSPAHTPSPPRESPSNMGKRKKKPKKMDDEFICDSPKRIKKTPFSKSDNDVGSSSGLALSRKRNSLSNGAQNLNDVTRRTMVRAEELQSTLGSEFPSFTKIMNRSHIINGWMGVPGNFGNQEQLPRKTIPVTLVDESGKEFELSYNGKKRGLSAGWKIFAIDQKLVEDDVLIFQLVETEPCKFKVYVVRANDFKDVDGALSLLNLEALIEQNNADNVREEKRPKGLSLTYNRRRMKSLHANTILMKKRKRRMISVAKTAQLAKKNENGCKPTYPSSSPSPNFANIDNFQDFSIMVDGLCVDSELPDNIRAKYYDLCSAKNDFLHARLRKGFNSKLIAGIICETVNLSDAIRTCSLMTSQDEFENWVKTLKSFELLGMSVGFLRERVSRLLELAFISEEAFERRKYVEAKVGRAQVEDEIVNLETKIIELKVASDRYSADVESLKYKAKNFELKFQEEVDALW